MISNEKRSMKSVSVWPGFVDALSALLMVVIFVLLLFVLAQFMLSEILFGQENELASLHRHMSSLVDRLGLEQTQSDELRNTVNDLTAKLTDASEENVQLKTSISDLTEQVDSDRRELEKRLLIIASLQEDIAALKTVRDSLESQVGDLSAAVASEQKDKGALRDRSKALEARLAGEQERTLLAQKGIERREIRLQALAALVTEQKEALDSEKQLTADARAEIMLLNQRVKNLSEQLDEISSALELAESEKATQKEKLEDLGKKLNIALARRVNKLEKYQSEFFGRLNEIIGENPNLLIEGDRFVLQAELLFASGSAEIGEKGRSHLKQLAGVIQTLSETIPGDIDWILRIDGHTDRRPIKNEQFPSNWELSTARAVSVVHYLASQGIPEKRMTAAGFSKYHPIDKTDSQEALRKNRRIEIKLTSR